MRIYEEYLSRHNIDIPFVQYCTNGSLILKTNASRSDWKYQIVSIKWQRHDHRPGQYAIELIEPVHDGYKFDVNFTNIQFPSELTLIQKKWDEYEDFILEWVMQLKDVDPIVEDDESLMALWEMFVYVHDSWFFKQPSDIKKVLYKSLDAENPDRIKYFNDIMYYLANHHQNILRTWRFEFYFRLQNYANWLAKLINKNQCKT